MIQDIDPHHLFNQYRPGAKADETSIVLCYTEEGLLCRVREDGTVAFPAVGEFPEAAQLFAEDLTYLFTVDTVPFFLLPQDPEAVPPGCSYVPVRKLRQISAGPKHLVFAAITGFQLSNWYRNNRFCGKCGGKTVHDRRERALRCPGCGHIIYPRIVPAVIVGVLDKETDRILLTKYRTGFAHYALVAGFTEIGETLEETVAREVMEETGLCVKNIRYYKSQPWGIVDDLLAGFYCDADGSREIHMDETELKLAEWKTRDEVVLQPDDFSLTNEMMMRFKRGEEC